MYQNVNYQFNRRDRKTLLVNFVKGQIKTISQSSFADANSRTPGTYTITDSHNSDGNAHEERAVFTVVVTLDDENDPVNTTTQVSIKSSGHGYAVGNNITLSASGNFGGTGGDITFQVSTVNTNDTDFKVELIEPMIIDKQSDVFLEHFTTYKSEANTDPDTASFIFKVNEFKIRNSTNDPKLMNSLIIPNEATADQLELKPIKLKN